jgi:hypothetical protein
MEYDSVKIFINDLLILKEHPKVVGDEQETCLLTSSKRQKFISIVSKILVANDLSKFVLLLF